MKTPNKKEENNENIRNILFDFWEAYQNKDADKRDEAIEKAVSEIDELLQSKKDNLIEKIEKMKLFEGYPTDITLKNRAFNLVLEEILSLIQEEL